MCVKVPWGGCRGYFAQPRMTTASGQSAVIPTLRIISKSGLWANLVKVTATDSLSSKLALTTFVWLLLYEQLHVNGWHDDVCEWVTDVASVNGRLMRQVWTSVMVNKHACPCVKSACRWQTKRWQVKPKRSAVTNCQFNSNGKWLFAKPVWQMNMYSLSSSLATLHGYKLLVKTMTMLCKWPKLENNIKFFLSYWSRFGHQSLFLTLPMALKTRKASFVGQPACFQNIFKKAMLDDNSSDDASDYEQHWPINLSSDPEEKPGRLVPDRLRWDHETTPDRDGLDKSCT